MNVDDKLLAITTNIKDRRVALHFSQDYMALKLNITQNAYSKTEMGKTKLSVQRLYQIAEILDTPAWQLININ